MLTVLTGPPAKRHLQNEPQTRSKCVDYSSPSMPSASTQHLEDTVSRAVISDYPLVTTPPYRAHMPVLDYPWLRTYVHPEIDGSGEKLVSAKRDQSPVAAFLQRRGVKAEDPEATPTRSLAWFELDSQSQLETPSIYGIAEEQDTSREGAVDKAFQPISFSQDRNHNICSGADYPSSESDSTYKESSSPELTSSSPVHGLRSSPPPRGVPKYPDQAEEGTNSMIAALLLHLCNILSKDSSGTTSDTVFSVSFKSGPLRVPTGDGGFIKTIPDLGINAEKDGYSTSILDYEGKRLKPNMTSIEKFAQTVAHLIGRAVWNRAAHTTSSRNVYLLTAQHTSVSIMQCTLLHKWLDRLPSDLNSLKKFARIQVQEYGPVDLAGGAERLVAAPMICRLLIGLGIAAKLGEKEQRLLTSTQIRRQGTLEGLDTKEKISAAERTGSEDLVGAWNENTLNRNRQMKRKIVV